MAFRIRESVVRGEIDNRVRGSVHGKIWVKGCEQPVLLDLRGNAHPDLAGCLLIFTNPRPASPLVHAGKLSPLQCGCIGDLTASRKIRVPAIPLEEYFNWPKDKGPRPTRWANSLYLEWFSEANGRVVIESADFMLQISEPEWRLTVEEEAERARQAAGAMEQFMQQLTEAIERQKRDLKDPEEQWDEHDYERFLKESDARTAKYLELLDKYGQSEDANKKIAEEMGWACERTSETESHLDTGSSETDSEQKKPKDEPAPKPDPQREGIDWIRAADGSIAHPLQHRCSESAMKYWEMANLLGLGISGDSDVEQFVSEFETTGTKLAGALNGIAEDRRATEGAFTVAWLKRALAHLHKSQAGLEGAAAKNILPAQMVTEARKELFEIREGILKLMDEFRGRQ